MHVKARKTGQGAITVPADADRAADELDRLLQQIAEDLPAGTLHLFYYGPLALLVRGARSLSLRRVPIIVYEAMKYDDAWHWLPAMRFPEGRLLISEPQTGVGSGAAVTSLVVNQPRAPVVPAPVAAVGVGAEVGRAVASSAFAFPLPLVKAYEKGELAVLVGSGASLGSDVVGNFPRWDELPKRLLEQALEHGAMSESGIAAKLDFLRSGYLSLEGMLSELESIKTALRTVRKYQAALAPLFRPANAKPGDAHRALVDLDVNLLLTTNYDLLLEAAEGPPRRTPYTWKEADKALLDSDDHRRVLFKIHGTAEREDTVIMTQGEYQNAHANGQYVRTLSQMLQRHTFLLVGYGINDPLDLDLIFELNSEVFGSASKTHYALMKEPSPTDRDRWQRKMNLQILPYADHGEIPSILRALRAKKP